MTLTEEFIHKGKCRQLWSTLFYIAHCAFLHNLAIRLGRVDISWIARQTLRHVLSGFISVFVHRVGLMETLE